jgi:hypothetical protein
VLLSQFGPEEVADADSGLSDIDVNYFSHYKIDMTMHSAIRSNHQGLTNSFSLSTHLRWLSSGVAVVKLRTRVSVSNSIKFRLKR